MVAPIPTKRRYRRGDPRTSVEAARRAAKASMPALRNVEALMQDGQDRIDWEMWDALQQRGYCVSLDTIQHGRLALSAAGVLLFTGRRRPTPTGSDSQLWVLNRAWVEPSRFVMNPFV